MSRRRFIALSIFLDALLVNAGIVLAFLVRFRGHLPAFNFEAYLIIAPFSTAVFLGAAWVYGLYDPERNQDAWGIVRDAVLVVTFGTVVEAAFAFFGGTRTGSFARSTILIGYVFDIVLLVGWRLVFLRFGRIRWPEQRVLIVGTGPVSVELAHALVARSEWGWRVRGMLSVPSSPGEGVAEVDGYPVLGSADAVADIVRQQEANRVIVVSPIALRELIERLVLADEVRVRVDVVPELYEIFIGRVDTLVGDIPLMRITSDPVSRYARLMKRVTDVAGALLVLILSGPLLLIGSLAILLEDGFPLLFRQERLGRNMKPFDIYKLRTMVKDAEALSGPVLADEDDPRITRVGRVLRRYRIDELPQLFNILRGDMSFVGPRPERSFFVQQYLATIPGYRERYSVKPGATGLAQVSGGYATTAERKLKYDLIYAYHQTMAMDARIIVETLRVVLTGRGAR